MSFLLLQDSFLLFKQEPLKKKKKTLIKILDCKHTVKILKVRERKKLTIPSSDSTAVVNLVISFQSLKNEFLSISSYFVVVV